MYVTLGAQKLSQVVHKKEVYVSIVIYLNMLSMGEGILKNGMYMIILGYLAYPSFKLLSNRRHQIVSGLLESIACQADKTFETMYIDNNKWRW